MMNAKARMNRVCIVLGPSFALLSGYFLYEHGYFYAIAALSGLVACIETRVRMGYRGPRKAVFAVHLACSFAYVVALFLLILLSRYSLWEIPLAWISYAGMLITGIILIRQSWRHPNEVFGILEKS